MKITNTYWRVLGTGLIIGFSFCIQTTFCQTIKTITNRKDILIGEQIKLTIRASLPVNSAGLNKWLILPDSIPHFDIVDAGMVDTLDYKDNSKAFEQVITLTSFDSGRWVFPALPVQFAQTGGRANKTIQTDSFIVNVSYSPPDSTNQIRDIKPIIKVSVTDYFWPSIIGGILLLLLIVLLVYRYFKKKQQFTLVTPTFSLSPYEEAMSEIKKLDPYNLEDAAAVKLFHTRLSLIFKNYITRKKGLNLLNKTTGDLLISMKESALPADAVYALATALRSTDAVKFAKYLPTKKQSEEVLQKIKQTINLFEVPIHINPKPFN